MLGKLATYLRMCGYDTAYALDRGVEADARIRRLAAAENRTLLTRDEQLAASVDDAILLTERG
ncbi:Mut7-C RNAse domain-containing protein, partial [Halolamina rubra]|uniref:Mut7-C RNAse domain-containing protein n=1 Tax=Halolamina rubra TaxID=1380430 RepID=UPI001F2F598E